MASINNQPTQEQIAYSFDLCTSTAERRNWWLAEADHLAQLLANNRPRRPTFLDALRSRSVERWRCPTSRNRTLAAKADEGTG